MVRKLYVSIAELVLHVLYTKARGGHWLSTRQAIFPDFSFPKAIELAEVLSEAGLPMKALAGLRRINLDGLRWRVFDAKGQVLGLLASQIAVVLQGKDKPTYTPHIENGDMCIVLNEKDISVTGRKMTDKIYY
ncbi:hypothetical protein ABZP36_031204 [Zizania latifolia]